MRVFRGFAIFLALAFVSIGIVMSFDSVSQPRAPASDHVSAGAVFCSLAFTLVYFLPRPVVK
jgi:hypothetical protein